MNLEFDARNCTVEPSGTYRVNVTVDDPDIDSILAGITMEEVLKHFGKEIYDAIDLEEIKKHFGLIEAE
jgi:hypothetical protein